MNDTDLDQVISKFIHERLQHEGIHVERTIIERILQLEQVWLCSDDSDE